ncbi:MAG: ATP synthase F1 subunit gamma [Deltaproteobacteria bacterium]|jgi:F-type H+-transporting ATPase subunit gamma|nr:ATP synthase F1 subunit gamma [Deltaproteobacteria bacterium]
MSKLKAIRKRIGSVRNTAKITKAMKMVAASRLRKAQSAIETLRPYAYRTRDIISQLAARADFSDHPLLEQREPKKVELLILTSDRGLCGGFNSNINRTADRYIRANERGHESIELDIVGRKGVEYFKRRNVQVNMVFKEILTDPSQEKASEIAEHAIRRFTEEGLDALYVVYNEFKSAMTQKVVVEQLLPIVPAPIDEGKYLPDFIYEPGKREIMDSVIPGHITVQILRMLLESVASEMGARMSAMDSATKNAGELISKLTMQYNRARQAAITKELIEIISGMEAL